MTLKIEKIVRKRRTTVRLIGRVQAEDLEEVAKQLATGSPGVVLELDERAAHQLLAIHTRVDEQRTKSNSRIAGREISSGPAKRQRCS